MDISSAKDEAACEEEWPISSKTPDKKVYFQGRAVNRGVALSVKDVREAARRLRGTKRLDRHPSARKQIFSTTEQDGRGFETLEMSGDRSSLLPEKFQMLGEFFDRFHDSIKLLRFKGSMTTFTKIFYSVSV